METEGGLTIWNHHEWLLALSASFKYLCYGSTAIIYIFFNSFSVGTVFRRQNLTFIFNHLMLWIAVARHNLKWLKINGRFWRQKTVPALKRLIVQNWQSTHCLNGTWRFCTRHHLLPVEFCIFQTEPPNVFLNVWSPRTQQLPGPQPWLVVLFSHWLESHKRIHYWRCSVKHAIYTVIEWLDYWLKNTAYKSFKTCFFLIWHSHITRLLENITFWFNCKNVFESNKNAKLI